MDLKTISSSNKGEIVNIADSNASDSNDALASVVGSKHKANEKESSFVNVFVSAATIMDYKATANMILTKATLDEEV